MKGRLAPGVLIQLLHELHDRRKTGTLLLAQKQNYRGLRFRMGDIENGLSSVHEEQMGEVLVREGVLSVPDLERASELLRREHKRLGQALLELGVFDERGLSDGLARHGREVLLRAFTDREGDYSFEEGEPATAPERETTLRIASTEMIVDVAHRLQDGVALRHAVGDLEAVFSVAPDPLERARRIGLTPEDAGMLARIDGRSSARELVERTGGDADQALRSLLALLCAGLIRKSAPRQQDR